MKTQVQRRLLLATVAALSAAAIMGIIAVFADLGDTGGRILATTLMVAAASVLSLASATAKIHERGLTAHGHAGMWAAGLALASGLMLLWFDGQPWFENLLGDAEWLIRAAACFGVLAVAAPHGGLLALARLRPHFEWMRILTWCAAGVLAVVLLMLILADYPDFDAWAKLITVVAIVATFGTVAVPILHRVSGIDAAEPLSTVPDEPVRVTCPRCGAAQELPLGDSECSSCALGFTIQVREQRCRCGYPTYGLPSDTCPECGHLTSGRLRGIIT